MTFKSGCDKSFSSGFMLLDLEKLSLPNLFRILFSSKEIKEKNFVKSSADEEDIIRFRERWITFISFAVQKLLLAFSKPLAGLGWLIETWLNLLHQNNGFFGLILNLVRGRKIIIPDRNGETFLSLCGLLDRRSDLDSNIKYGDNDSKYFAALSMMASKTIYENEAFIKNTVTKHWKMEFLNFSKYWNDYQEKAKTQVFLLRDKGDDHDTIIVAFRGTETFNSDDWCSDVDLSWYELAKVGKIHSGFMKALGMQKNHGWPTEVIPNDQRKAPLAYYDIRDRLKQLLNQNEQTKFIVTGHSLGGAMAILFPAILAFHKEEMLLERLGGVYTFGQPRVGDGQFGEYMKKMLKENRIKYYRFVYGNDIVPRLPFDNKTFMFKHFGTCLCFDRNYKGKLVVEEPNKNYFLPLTTIPKILNAIMELKRSFTIGYSKGPEFKESWSLIIFRLMGLSVPGVPVHISQDYVNSTRLVSPDLFDLSPQQTTTQGIFAKRRSSVTNLAAPQKSLTLCDDQDHL